MKIRKKKKADARLAARIKDYEQTISKANNKSGFTKPGSRTK